MKAIFKKINSIKNHVKQTGDSEPEQASVRVLISLILIVIFVFSWGSDSHFYEIQISILNIVVLSYFFAALVVIAAILITPKPSPARRVLGIFIDLASLSFLMFVAVDEAVSLFVFYLWVILGNGFRYGIKYLYLSLAVGLVGFLCAIYLGSYWQEHRSIAISFLIVITLIPLYSIFLINKLYSAISMAEKANQAKSRFLAHMSHELRTPLNGVIGLGELLKETKLDKQQHNLVSTMHNSAKTLLGLIEKVLDISKIEAGKIIITNESFDLHSLINSVIATQKLIAESKGLSITYTIDSDVPFLLEGDQQYIRQVLVNLIGNAIKFTDQGSVNLHIYNVSEIANSAIIRFDIKDTGIGIEKHSLEQVFDDFTQVGSARTQHIEGTGLGTTISKDLIELMGGKIGVESRVNQGSTFWFELPFTTLPNTALEISDSHLLVIATDHTTSLIRPLLSAWALPTDFVKSPAHAISLLKSAFSQNQGYKIILVDALSLPGITPVEFATLLESEKLLGDLSLVLFNSTEDYLYNDNVGQYYISVIKNLGDKRAIFNAIHVAQSNYGNNENVVSISEYYASQKGSIALNVLIAEDNKVNQQVLSGILKRAGHSVIITDDGEQALDVLAKDLEQIDLLIVDKNMPKYSGDQVVQALRFMDTSNKLPIIMLTADATPEARELGMSLGINEFLTKPIDSHDLLKKIATISQEIDQQTPKKTSVSPVTTSKKLHKSSQPEITEIDDQWCNLTVLQELFLLDNDLGFMQRLIKGFIQDGDLHIVRIREAIIDDYLQLRESLHALKGAASELGAEKLSEICRQGETYKPYDIGTEKLNLLINDIEFAYIKTVEALNKALSKAATAES